jgi:Fe-S-cluster containining protein
VPDPQARLRALHDEIDREAASLAARHRARLHCRRGCNACCVDGLSVFEVEAERIRSRHPVLLHEGTPHPPGACAFLGDAGECRVYAERPYVCRTQGLPLRWVEEDASGERVERRDICPLNAEGEPLEALAEADCWTLGRFEQRLRRIQEALDGGAGRRVALRALFRRRGNDPLRG